jgi:Zn-dependent protease
MRWTYRIGRLFGFPIEINVSFLLLLGVIFLTAGGAAGVLTVLLAFGSVLLHELGHALTARRLGVPIAGIELNFFGGAAKMTRLPRTPRDEIVIAAAGPAVSLALGALGLGLGALTGWSFAVLVGAINVVLGVFNLVPALPMDGGRILRAVLARRRGFVRATSAAVTVSRVFSVVFGVVGLATGHFQLAVLALVLWTMASQERRVSAMMGGYGVDEGDAEVLRAGEEGAAPPSAVAEPLSAAAAAGSHPGHIYVVRDPWGRVQIRFVG